MLITSTQTTVHLKSAVAALLALAALIALAAPAARAADGPTRIVFISGKEQRCKGDACNGFDVVRSVTPHGRGAQELGLVSSAFDAASTESGTVAVLSRNVAGGGANSNSFSNVYLISPDGKRKAVFRKRIEGFLATGIGIAGDGRLLVLSARYAEATGNSRSKLFLVRADGTGFRQLTTGAGNDETPALSADGRRIVFSRTIGESRKPDLYVMPTAGGPARRLTENGLVDINPVFSPDGRKIAFGQFNQRTHRGSIAVMRSDGGGLRTLSSTFGEYPEPDFSPNGRNLAYVAEIPKKGLYESALYTVRASGGQRSLVTRAFEHPVGAQWTLRP